MVLNALRTETKPLPNEGGGAEAVTEAVMEMDMEPGPCWGSDHICIVLEASHPRPVHCSRTSYCCMPGGAT